jgi:hypothetical protein
MATAQKLMLDSYEGRRERTRLHRASNEECFGLQIATSRVSEGIFAGKLAAECGLDFIGAVPNPLLLSLSHARKSSAFGK